VVENRRGGVVGEGVLDYHEVAAARLMLAVVGENLRHGLVWEQNLTLIIVFPVSPQVRVVRAGDEDGEGCPGNRWMLEVGLAAGPAIAGAAIKPPLEEVGLREGDVGSLHGEDGRLAGRDAPRV
jgi:hypothetical protein